MSREPLEQDGLALHDGQRRQGAEVAQPEHGRAVRDHGDGVALDRQPAGVLGVRRDGQAHPPHARGVGQRQVVTGAQRHLGPDLQLAPEVGEEDPVGHLADLHPVQHPQRLGQLLGVVLAPGGGGDVDLEPVRAGGRDVQRGDDGPHLLHHGGELADRGGPGGQLQPDGDGVGDARGGHGPILARAGPPVQRRAGGPAGRRPDTGRTPAGRRPCGGTPGPCRALAPDVTAPTVHAIHENPAWWPPFAAAFEAEGVPVQQWLLTGEDTLDLAGPPPEGVFWSRMSASAHTRGHGRSVAQTRAVLRWLEGHGRRVVNGSAVLELEVSKVAQDAALRAAGVPTPLTVAAFGPEQVLEAARAVVAAGARSVVTKHNQGGKGLGVRRFDDLAELEQHLAGDDWVEPVDGVALVQEYVRPRRAVRHPRRVRRRPVPVRARGQHVAGFRAVPGRRVRRRRRPAVPAPRGPRPAPARGVRGTSSPAPGSRSPGSSTSRRRTAASSPTTSTPTPTTTRTSRPPPR